MVLGLSGMPSMADARASRSCWLLSTSSWTTNFQVPTRLGVTRTPRSSASISNTLPLSVSTKSKASGVPLYQMRPSDSPVTFVVECRSPKAKK